MEISSEILLYTILYCMYIVHFFSIFPYLASINLFMNIHCTLWSKLLAVSMCVVLMLSSSDADNVMSVIKLISLECFLCVRWSSIRSYDTVVDGVCVILCNIMIHQYVPLYVRMSTNNIFLNLCKQLWCFLWYAQKMNVAAYVYTHDTYTSFMCANCHTQMLFLSLLPPPLSLSGDAEAWQVRPDQRWSLWRICHKFPQTECKTF